MKTTIKVVLICHFSTKEIRDKLPLDNRWLYASLRWLLRLPSKGCCYCDIASWNKDLIEFLSQRDDIDLYVISAHSGLKRRVCDFQLEGVHYWFIRCDFTNLLQYLVKNDDVWRKLNTLTPKIRSIINKIHPDIINLLGNENSYYSASVLGIQGYPIYSLCQTIYNNPDRSKYGEISSKNASTELEIFRKVKYYGVYCKMHYGLLRKLNPEALIFKFGYPRPEKLLQPIYTNKEYDFVNFATEISEKKGYFDAVKALAIVKKKHSKVRLNLVGSTSTAKMTAVHSLIDELGLQDNVVFTSFFEKQSDMFRHIQKSRFALLPCKLDNVSNTMVQAMQLGLPLVVYETLGTPCFNKGKECVLIAKKNNINDLAAKMLLLLEHPEKAELLRKNALEYQQMQIEYAKNNGDRLVENYKAVIRHYHAGQPIPREQLFNPERDD